MSHHQPIRAFSARAKGSLRGTIRIPGDKSISHRALMFGGLAKGETIISGLLEGEDVLCTAAALQAMGAKIGRGEDGLWRCFGVGTGCLKEPEDVLDMGNSGTSTRLLAGLIAAHPIHAVMTGDRSLRKRPMKRIMDPLSRIGATFSSRDGGRLPMAIAGARDPKAITYELPVASAQVKSAVLLAGLNCPGETVVIEPRATRDHTERMLRHFGAQVRTETASDGRKHITLSGPQQLQGCAIDVPSDPSSAAFFIVAALLCPGSDLRMQNICLNPTRTGLIDTLLEMGADMTIENRRDAAGEPVGDLLVRGGGPLKGIRVPEERVPSMIDEFPVLAMAAACAEGETEMRGLGELRVKESDRLAVVADGLAACGADLETGEDWMIVRGKGRPPRGGAEIDTHLDHRIAMSFFVLGLVTSDPVVIDDSAPIRTSFPNFLDLMAELGVEVFQK